MATLTIATSPAPSVLPSSPASPKTRGLWTETEHERFLDALKLYPMGPWRTIAGYIGTRSIKQVQTHAQKYQEKLDRMKRGLRKHNKIVERPGHRVDRNAHVMGVRYRRSRSRAQSAPARVPPAGNAPAATTTPSSVSSVSVHASAKPFASAMHMEPIDPLPFFPMPMHMAPDMLPLWEFDQLHESLELFLATV